MSPSNNFIVRPVLTTVCSLIIVIAGLISIPLLPVENLPDIAPSTVNVSALYGGADAVTVEQGVTNVLEQQINGVENMDYITSSSSADGRSEITVSFASGTNGDINQVNVQNRVSLANPSLPDEVRQSGVVVNKASNNILLVYNFVSEDPEKFTYSAETISGLLDQNLTDAIRRIPGVGDLTYFGERKLAFRLWLDPDKLTAFGLTSNDVVEALSSQNRLVPAGQVGGEPALKGQEFTFTVQLKGRLVSEEEFNDLIIRTTPDGGILRLRDVGRASLGGENYALTATDIRGVPSVGMAVYQLSGTNALRTSAGIKKVLDDFQSVMPVGLKMEKIYDSTDFINASIKGVLGSLRDAVMLVVLILFLFLQNWKATLVPGIAIPVALVGTFALVNALGFSLNQLTLFGLILATGLVVDDAITVIEDTSTKKAQGGVSAVQAAMGTMEELFSAVIATSVVLFAVFLPVLFFPGATGTIYKQFAATIIFSVAISTFNALTFSPMLSALLLANPGEPPSRRTYAIAGGAIGFIYGLMAGWTGVLGTLMAVGIGLLVGYLAKLITGLPLRLPCVVGGAVSGLLLAGVERPIPVLLFTALGIAAGWFTPSIFRRFNALYGQLEGGYHGLLEWVLHRRGLVMTVLAGGILLTGVAFRAIPSGFVPIEDQGYALGIVQAPDGGSIQVTQRINDQVGAILRDEEDITAASLFSGASFDGNAPNKGLFFFGTRHWDDRASRDQAVGAITQRLNRRFAAEIQDARVVVIEPPAIPGYG